VPTLKEKLIVLREGHGVPFGEHIERLTVYGDEGMSPTLFFRDGEWKVEELNCSSGNCGCLSHDRYRTEVVRRKIALEILKSVIEAEEAEEAARAAERKWLDDAIASLGQDDITEVS